VLPEGSLPMGVLGIFGVIGISLTSCLRGLQTWIVSLEDLVDCGFLVATCVGSAFAVLRRVETMLLARSCFVSFSQLIESYESY